MLCLITIILFLVIFPPKTSFQPDCYLCVKRHNTPLPVRLCTNEVPLILKPYSRGVAHGQRPALVSVLCPRVSAAGTHLGCASCSEPSKESRSEEQATAKCLQLADKKPVL